MNNRSKKGSILLILAVIIAIIAGAIWLISNIASNILGFNNGSADNQVSSIVVSYLDKKYGHQPWEVTSTKELSTSTDTMGLTSSQIGFTAEAQLAIDDDIYFFKVTTEGTDPSSTVTKSDNFISIYYLNRNKGISNFAGYTVDASFSFAENNAPNNIGHIPNVSELVSYGVITEIDLRLKNPQSLGSSDTQKIENIRKLAIAAVNYFNVTTDITVSVSPNDYGIYSAKVTTTSITVKISGDDNLYTFSR